MRAPARAGAAIAALLVACSSSSSPPKVEPKGAPIANVTQGTAMPSVRTAADIATHDGQVVVAVGTYAVEDLGRYRVSMTMPDGTVYKTNQSVSLDLADGTYLQIGARPEDERAQWTGKQVEIEAKVLAKPPAEDPRAAQMSPKPMLVEITAVRAASAP